MPSQRPKKRYVAFHIQSAKEIDTSLIRKSIHSAFKHHIGESEMQHSNFYFYENRFNRRKNRGLLRVAPAYKDQLLETLHDLTEIDNHAVNVESIGISGTMKKAYGKYIAS